MSNRSREIHADNFVPDMYNNFIVPTTVKGFNSAKNLAVGVKKEITGFKYPEFFRWLIEAGKKSLEALLFMLGVAGTFCAAAVLIPLLVTGRDVNDS